VGALHEFGRYFNDLEHRARHTQGAEDVKALLMAWLGELGYEQHLHDNEEQEKLASARWGNVLDFVDWIARRCGGEIDDSGGLTRMDERKSLLDVAQTIALITTLAEREGDAEVVTLSTLHAAKGLEWPHVILAGVNEGLLPFLSEGEEMDAQRLEEERRLMYVGITRARTSLAVSTLKRRKRGRDTVAAQPSRFIAEMRLHEGQPGENPRDRLRRLREELAAQARAQDTSDSPTAAS
jgi:ATP-dependent DNA helicase Rep